ncbi:hypothetical protein ABK040_003988 [Willaertia magna]
MPQHILSNGTSPRGGSSNSNNNSGEGRLVDDSPFGEEELQLLYTWIDEIPLSRPKRNIARDFSDGVLMAEVVKHFFPKIVELHNYSAASSSKQKLYNWNTLEQKVFQRVGFHIEPNEIEDVVKCKPYAIEKVLKNFQQQVTQMQQRKITVPEQTQTRSKSAPKTRRNIEQQQQPLQQQQIQQPQQQNIHKIVSKKKEENNLFHHNQHQEDEDEYIFKRNIHSSKGTTNNPLIDQEILKEKDAKIHELEETIKLLESKVNKLQLLLRLKDSKIQALMSKKI